VLHIKPNKSNKEKLLNLSASFLNDDPHIWGVPYRNNINNNNDSSSNNDSKNDAGTNIVDDDDDVNNNVHTGGIFDFLYN
jgi:hypothetical protein